MLDFQDLLRVSFRQVWRQRARYLGVVLTVMFGTAGLVVINTIGDDVKTRVNRDLDLLGGVTLIKVYYSSEESTMPPTAFKAETLEKLRALPGVEGISALAMKVIPARTILGGQRFVFTLVGVDAQFWAVNSSIATMGRLLTAEEVAGRRRVCVLGERLAEELYGRRDVVGERIPIDGDLYEIVGLLGGASAGDRDRWAFIPVTTAQDRIYPLIPPNRLYMRCSSMEQVESVAAAVRECVTASQAPEGLQVEVARDRLHQVRRTSWWIEVFVYVAVLATLALGGFGIWTIMMSAVRARTREIGVKKAMGAADGDILAQFLAESATLSLVGGIAGGLLGRAVIGGICQFMGSMVPGSLMWLTMAASLLAAFALGIGAGFYPSFRASRMDVVTAIRYE